MRVIFNTSKRGGASEEEEDIKDGCRADCGEDAFLRFGLVMAFFMAAVCLEDEGEQGAKHIRSFDSDGDMMIWWTCLFSLVGLLLPFPTRSTNNYGTGSRNGSFVANNFLFTTLSGDWNFLAFSPAFIARNAVAEPKPISPATRSRV